MKNSSPTRMAKSQRSRTNFVWLMNAASLAIAIGSIGGSPTTNDGTALTNNKAKSFSFIPEAKAIDYFYAGGTALKAGPAAFWLGSTAKASGTVADWTNTSTAFGGNDNIYFGGSGAMASTYSYSATMDIGSSNVKVNSLNYSFGAGAYTLTGTNSRKFEVGSTASGAGDAIKNSSSSAINLNVIIRASGGTLNSNAATFNQNSSTGSLNFNGAGASTYIVNPYAYDWALTQTSTTSAQAATFAKDRYQAIAIADANSGSRYVKLAGIGTINVTQGIGDAWRGNGGSSTSPYSVNGVGNLTITNTGATNLSGWNTYTGTTTIGDGTTTGGVVTISTPYAFGGNRLADATAPNNTLGTGLAYGGANTTAYFTGVGGTVASGFKAVTQAFGAVTIGNGFTVDLNGVTMLGANALTLNGTGASAASAALKNSNATAATYVGAITLGSSSNIDAGSGNITLSGGLNTSTFTATLSGAQNSIVSGVLAGSGSINKTGAGTLTLSGNNTYTGAINIDQGTVNLAGASGASLGSAGALTLGASNTPTLTLGGRATTVGAIASTNTAAIIQNANATGATLTSTGTTDTAFAGLIQDGTGGGALALNKSGAGVLHLSGANTYTGATNITGGAIKVSGSIASAITVGSSGTLSGSGTVSALTASGAISPGNAGVGTLTAGATSLASGGILNIQMYDAGSTAGTGWDLLAAGAVTVNSTSGSRFTINLNSISSSTSTALTGGGNAINFDGAVSRDFTVITGTSLTSFDATKFTLSTANFLNSFSGVWTVASDSTNILLRYTAPDLTTILYWNGSSGLTSSSTALSGGTGNWSTLAAGYDATKGVNFANTAGTVTVTTVAVAQGMAFDTSGYTLSGSTIDMTGVDATANSISVGTGLTATISSTINSATVAVNKTGAGTLVLSGDNKSGTGIAGGLTISAGTIKVGNANALGQNSSAVTVGSGTVLDINGNDLSSATNAVSLSGSITNTAGTAATFGGAVTLGLSNSIGSTIASNLTLSGGVALNGYNLTLNPATATLNVTGISGTGNVAITSTSNGAVTIGGTVNNTGTITNNGSSTGLTQITGNIGTGVTSVIQNSTNSTLVLSGTNTYTGTTTVSAGTLKLGSATALGASAGAATVASGATLDLNGQTLTNTNTLSLSGTGVSGNGALVNNSASASTYAGLVSLAAASKINAASGNITLSNAGTITGSGFALTSDGSFDTTISSIIGNGAGGVTKTGTGTLTLSGANTYTGANSINAGKVKLGNAAALGASGAGVTVASGATLDLNGQTVVNTNALSLSGTGSAGAGGALVNNNVAAASYAGAITLTADSTVNASAGNITLANLAVASAKALTIDGAFDTTITSVVSAQTPYYIKNGTGTLILGTNARLTSSSTTAHQINAGIIRSNSTQPFGSSGTAVAPGVGMAITTLNIANGGSFDLNGNNQNKTINVTLNGTGAAGAGGPLYNSSVTLAKFQGNFLLSSNTTLAANNGGLELGASGSTGTGLNLKNYTLTLDGTGTSTSNIISSILVGAGGLVKTGTGTWKLTPIGNSGFTYLDSFTGTQPTSVAVTTANNAQLFTGTIAINAGTLVMGNVGALGAATGVNVASGATLDLGGLTFATTNALTISGTGAAGAGGALVNNSAANTTYAGAITLAADSTIYSSSGAITMSGGLNTSNFTASVVNGTTASISSLSGSGALNKSGLGNLTLSGANTYTGVTNVNAGKLVLGNASALGTSSATVAVASGATLDLGGLSITNTNALSISGTGAGTAGATGALTSSSTTATYAGNITLADDATIYATAGDVILSGVISGNKQLTILNSSASKDVVLTGASANTFGSINLAGYDLTFTAANQLGSGTIASSSANARLVYGQSTVGSNAAITIANQLNTGADSAKVLALVPNGDTNTITVSGLVTGSGKLKVSGVAGNTLFVTNTSNDYSGGTEIGTGVISIASDAVLGTGAVNFGTTSSSVLAFTDNVTTSRNFTQSAAGYTANIDVASGKTVNLTGTISPTSTGGLLTKTGAGTLTLSGANTYSGATTISAGVLAVKDTGSIASSDVTVANGATLKGLNTTTTTANVGGITLSSGALMDLTAGSLKAASLTVATLLNSDVTTISYTIGNTLALTGGLTLTGNLSIDLTSTINGAGVYDVLTYAGSKSGSGTISFVDHSNSDWVMTGELNTSTKKYTITVAGAFSEGGNYSTGNVTVPLNGTLGAISGSVTVTAANTTTVGAISGGTVTLSGTGNTVGAVSGGTVNLNAAGSTVSSLATGGTLNVNSASTITSLTGGTLAVATGVDASVASGTSTATITGAGNLLKTGNGTLTLSGTSSNYTGSTKVTAGTLAVTDVAALGSTSGVTLGTSSNTTAATFNYSGSATTISTNISALSSSNGGNTIENSGSGLLTLGGTLAKNGTVLTLAGGSNGITVTGNITGASANSDLVVSTGTVQIDTNNTYVGPTLINAGATLIANSATATGTSGIVNISGTLQVGTVSNILTLTTGGFALHNGATIRVFVDHIDISSVSATSVDGYTHYDLTGTAGTAYSTLLTSGALDVTGVTAGGITIDVYSDSSTEGFLKRPFYDFKFLQAGSVTGLGSGLNIADLFTISTTNLKYQGGGTVVAQYAGQDLSSLIHVYTANSGGNTILMMSIPEPSTYGLGLGALALAAVAIRRRKQKKVVA